MASGRAGRQGEAGNERSAANGIVIQDGEVALKPPPAKRRRVALACNACRTRKSRVRAILRQCLSNQLLTRALVQWRPASMLTVSTA